MKILVVDDERPSRQSLCDIIATIRPDAQLLSAAGGVEAIDFISGNDDISLVFLDIEMGDINGISVAMAINKISPKTKIVFATAFSEHALKAFELGAVDYILKPFDEARIKETLNRVGETVKTNPDIKNNSERITLSSGKTIKIITVRDIAYVETSGRGCVVHLIDGQAIPDQRTISAYEHMFMGNSFFRIHKSFLANLEHLKEISPQHGGYMMLIEGQNVPLPIGRAALKILRQIYQF